MASKLFAVETRHADAHAISLSRTDPKRNMARFYGLSVERDLFGRVVLVRQ